MWCFTGEQQIPLFSRKSAFQILSTWTSLEPQALESLFPGCGAQTKWPPGPEGSCRRAVLFKLLPHVCFQQCQVESSAGSQLIRLWLFLLSLNSYVWKSRNEGHLLYLAYALICVGTWRKCFCFPVRKTYTVLLPGLNEGGGLCSISSNINTLTIELRTKNCDLSNDLSCLLYVTFYLFREVLIRVKSAWEICLMSRLNGWLSLS